MGKDNTRYQEFRVRQFDYIPSQNRLVSSLERLGIKEATGMIKIIGDNKIKFFRMIHNRSLLLVYENLFKRDGMTVVIKKRD